MIPLRCYTVPLAATSSAAAIDWFELVAGSGSGLVLLGLDIGQSTEAGDTAEEQIDYYIKRASGSYTSGSGGNDTSSVTPVAARAGDASPTFDAETANTTRIAVGTGTLTTVHNSTFNLRAGLQLFWTPETAFTCGPSQALAVGMTSAPADAVTWVGTAYVGELVP